MSDLVNACTLMHVLTVAAITRVDRRHVYLNRYVYYSPPRIPGGGMVCFPNEHPTQCLFTVSGP